MRYSFKQKLHNGIIGGLGVSLLSCANLFAQKEQKEQKSFIQHLIPTNVSATFACHHWIGPEWYEHGNYIGSLNSQNPNLSQEDVLDALIVKYNNKLIEKTAYYESREWENSPPKIDETHPIKDIQQEVIDAYGGLEETAKNSVKQAQEKLDYLKQIKSDGTQFYFTKEEVETDVNGKKEICYELEEKKVHKFNQRQNFGVIADFNIFEKDDFSIGISAGYFNNSYYKDTWILLGNFSTNNVMDIPRLKFSAQLGVTTGYDASDVGDFAYLGSNKSLMAGISLGYTFKSGVNVALRVTPSFVAPAIGIDTERAYQTIKDLFKGNKSSYSCENNSSIKKQRWLNKHGYHY